ncbi:prohormone-1-like isoform X2 [Limulus polyphemus]|uniref:Prohormone-1-like isoform X2 n=1 Tax=Limulus polyphemus TaxID=6850 RepID=A0ABM1SR50_LIMPO|nr:prohormone-1-like isoform X2 [Limulus polyphemus]
MVGYNDWNIWVMQLLVNTTYRNYRNFLTAFVLERLTALSFISKTMTTLMKICILLLISVILLITAGAKSIGETEQQFYPSDLDLVDDDGSMDAALINYLFARQMMRRLNNNLDTSDLQRKRSYWKQCAFNAVSCFGRK